MKKKILILNFCVLSVIFLSAVSVSASEIDLKISVNQEIFRPLDEVNIEISVTNKSEFKIQNLNLISGLGGICEGQGFQEFVNLDVGETKLFEAYKFEISDFTASGDCEVNVNIFDSSGEIVVSSLEWFSIEDTLKDMQINTSVCKDLGCAERSKTFIKGADVYLDFESSVEDIEITAILTYPNRIAEELTLPHFNQSEKNRNICFRSNCLKGRL